MTAPGIQRKVRQHDNELASIYEIRHDHGEELREIRTILADHGATLAEHGRKLDEVLELLRGRSGQAGYANGSRTRKVVPCWGTVRNSMRPLCASRIAAVIAKPRPVPPRLRMRCGSVRPGSALWNRSNTCTA
jgi:hypothetical protein